MTLMAGGQRALWLAVAALPFLVLPPGVGIALLIALVTIAAMLGAVGAVPWLSWMADLVPKDMRGRYFATRNLIMGTVGLVLGPVVGLFLDLWQGWAGSWQPHSVSSSSSPQAPCWDCWRCGCCSSSRNRPWCRDPANRSVRQLSCPGRTPSFRRLIFFRGYYIFVVNLAGPFFVVYHLQGLGLSFGTVYVLNTVGQLAMLLALRWWGRLCDRWGPRKVLLVNTIGKGVFPLFYIGMAVTAPGSPTALTWVLLLAAQVSMRVRGRAGTGS